MCTSERRWKPVADNAPYTGAMGWRSNGRLTELPLQHAAFIKTIKLEGIVS